VNGWIDILQNFIQDTSESLALYDVRSVTPAEMAKRFRGHRPEMLQARKDAVGLLAAQDGKFAEVIQDARIAARVHARPRVALR
jgi:hypothetical protein